MERSTAIALTSAALKLIKGKIKLPFRQLEPAGKKFLAKLQSFVSDIQAMSALIEDLDKDHVGDDGYETNPLDDLIVAGVGIFGQDVLAFLRRAEDALKDITESYGLEWTLDHVYKRKLSLTALVKAIDSQVIEPIAKLVKRRTFKALDKEWVGDAWGEYEYTVKSLKANNVPYMKKPDLKELRKLVQTFHDIRDEAEEFKSRVQVSIDEVGGNKPASDDVEVLYHASVDAAAIHSKGFDPKVPEGKGLGGSNKDKCNNAAIAFTSDLYVAKEVMRGLKEATMIANGKLKSRHIIDWAKRAGVWEEVQESYENLNGDLFGSRAKRKPDDPIVVFGLYKMYMQWAGNLHNPMKHKRYDPAFFGSRMLKGLKGKSHRNVGVVAAEVDMTDECIMYSSSMQEYRVQPSSVVRVVRLIKG